jgi:hypothetical protein
MKRTMRPKGIPKNSQRITLLKRKRTGGGLTSEETARLQLLQTESAARISKLRSKMLRSTKPLTRAMRKLRPTGQSGAEY